MSTFKRKNLHTLTRFRRNAEFGQDSEKTGWQLFSLNQGSVDGNMRLLRGSFLAGDGVRSGLGCSGYNGSLILGKGNQG